MRKYFYLNFIFTILILMIGYIISVCMKININVLQPDCFD